MSKLGFQHIAGAIAFITLGLAIGCGDGTVHREHVIKTPASGRSKAMQNGTVGGLGKSSDLGAKLETEAAIGQLIDADSKKTIIQINDFPKGTYTLSTVETLFKYLPDASSNWVSFLSQGTVAVAADGLSATLTPNSHPIKTGVLNNVTDPGRGVEVPIHFKVNPDVAFTNNNDGTEVDHIFVHQVVTSNADLASSDRIVTQWNPTLPLEAVINGTINDKSITVSLQKVDETHYQAVLRADDPKTSAKSLQISRTMIFVYTFVPEPDKSKTPPGKGGLKKTSADGGDVNSQGGAEADPNATQGAEEIPAPMSPNETSST